VTDVLFIVKRETDATGGRWAYIQSCPHGMDLGAIHLGPLLVNPPGGHWHEITWKFTDLGNGRCRIEPSILARGVHEGRDCHFGPGEFAFVWLEVGQLRDPTTGLPGPRATD
jgi:hypothetical protein